jgi:hypothetical protein
MTDKPVITDAELDIYENAWREALAALGPERPREVRKAALSAFLLARVPPPWAPCSTDDHAQGYAAGFNDCREQVLRGKT